MHYTVLTLFPQLIRPWTEEALLGRAVRSGRISFDIRDLREHAGNKHRRVDDTPYGGGAGMVIRVDVAARALAAVREVSAPDEVILLTPAGEPLTQPLAETLAAKGHLCLLSGRYEGFDARVETLVTREVSVGDFVMMGGEVAALALIEATARLLPGVLGDAESFAQDSFTTGLLDYPEYTRPLEWEGQRVPEVLLSGHHANVARWRRERALERTLKRRPELLERAALTEADRAFLRELGRETDAPES
ncbi:tRNA (guanosine(37)-N1)-methyltransferase TrmD [Truepera radiovictrix]|uniref:tRNA (guanine-N(1)-)-methyltransferase n=1 Tax=Truepera radiovictrix (strain DSM 17093 / CIP 108686 / LMG 22925 / RQ-24) TaxID=649638 RepID=D7CX87_TRURR|nr:tRNA (guanosine(37)-N1)-methyltransferase TrmD [Truepera radiovictrix]ADI13211.1 tRNA (guanine-N1)-methyltransferase [Truepera radiovictrix DSM 17093]WMT58223.1 tRNA (guanosine(37)-N1)-methyltransferase TrmD [Truepera radiovictrix]